MNKYRILSGMLFGLFYTRGFSQEKKGTHFPGFRGTIEIKHSIPGRIRFFVPAFVNSSTGKEFLEDKMCTIEGIKKVEANTLTGSILVIYETEKIDELLIVGIVIKLLGLEDKIQSPEISIIRQEIKKWNEALSYSLSEKTKGLLDMKTALSLMFLFYGVKGLAFSTEAAKSNPYSLLYWAYRSLVLEGDSR
ncbi:HMA2 domain-containing protein [Desulfosporosinus hippei]|uniref:Uncharacterized protein n=1 Tax=Desulfosporosinus hippei DSM 8344 TaxID=1121419 RepID=A0A1G7UG50_9FIRM|nr:hypothetical protein [Desulfosporosinus hippei]SDG46251.1 hypothetical protein SAMN05443529_103128 [Desulfosporosinus hippei DSM 8344]